MSSEKSSSKAITMNANLIIIDRIKKYSVLICIVISVILLVIATLVYPEGSLRSFLYRASDTFFIQLHVFYRRVS